MKTKALGGFFRHICVIAIALGAGALGLIAQNSMPAPGMGSAPQGNSMPRPGAGGSFNPAPANGIGWNP